jgi:hypothetical protein
MKTNFGLADCVRIAVFSAVACVVCHGAKGAQYQWDFGGNLNATFGNATLSYATASSETLTAFGTTNDTTVPHIGGQPASYIHIPAFADPSEGYNAEFVDTGPNGGGEYVNQYTMIFDFLEPAPLNWTPFFNTNPENANDADFYLASDGAVGIGADYSPIGAIAPNTWYRVAFTADLAADQFTIYVNGVQQHQRTTGPLLDGRWALYSNADAGHDIRMFNEGDSSGIYTHELYMSSFFFADRTLSASEIQAIGGPDADGIASPTSADYNHDGFVDAADYVLLRKTGLTPEKYAEWRSQFGESISMGTSDGIGSSGVVPEPSSAAFVFLTFIGCSTVVRRQRAISALARFSSEK